MADQENWKKVKGIWKRTKDLASKGALGTGGEGWKKKKKKDYVTDPDATFGGKKIRIKDGPEIKVDQGSGRSKKSSEMTKQKPIRTKSKGLNRGYKSGGAVLKGKKVGIQIK